MRKARARKDRKRRFRAPIHQKKKFLHVTLSKELRAQKGKRAMLVKKGYRVRVLRGKHRGKEGLVIKVSHVKAKVYVEGITATTARGQEKPVPISPSNLMIVSLGG